MPFSFRSLPIAAAALLACAPTTNLLNPTSPSFSGSHAPVIADSASEELRIVTFNIKLGRAVERGIEVLSQERLLGADLIALQEMDEAGVERIARTLKLNYIYYPGSIHPTDNRYYGPALLSPWPIEKSWKLLLPHEGLFRRQRRTATAAVLRIGSAEVLAYSLHLEPQLRISEKERRDQVLTILRDAATFPGPVVLAGDFNSEGIGPLLVRHGYHWVTANVGPTITIFSWDHIFVRGLEPDRSGVVRRVRGASDHKPVWALARAYPLVPDGSGGK